MRANKATAGGARTAPRARKPGQVRALTSVVAAFAAALIAVGAAPPAFATSQENSSRIPGTSATLRTQGWLATFASGGCSDWTNSAYISGGWWPRSGKDWVRTYVKFIGYGFPPDLSSRGESGDTVDHQWTNNNGSRGAYLSGNLCTSWTTVAVDLENGASTFYYGVTHSVYNG